MAVGKKKLLAEIDIFLQENSINQLLEKIKTNIQSNDITSDSDCVYLWQDYHHLGNLLNNFSKYQKKLKK